jgi:hypothetical protein
MSRRGFCQGSVIGRRLNDYIEGYHRHPEAKAADQNGNPAGPDTVGLLGRLRVRSEKLARIGKEVDRLDQDEGASLESLDPAEYTSSGATLEWALGVLRPEPANEIAPLIGMSDKRFRDIRRGCVKEVRSEHREAIIALARSRADRAGAKE